MTVLHLRCLEGVRTKLHAKFGENRTNGSSSFSKFQDGGRRPSWIMNFAILRAHASSECGVDDTCQIWCIQVEPFRSYSNFSKFRFFVDGHLGLKKMAVWPFRCLEGVKTKLHAKFGENRTNGSGVIQVFANFKMAAGGHLGL